MKKNDRGGSGGKGKDVKPGTSYPANNPNKAFPMGFAEYAMEGYKWNGRIYSVAKVRNKADTGSKPVAVSDSIAGLPNWDKYVPPKTNMVGKKPKPANNKAAKKK